MLSQFLTSELFSFFMIFCRLGSALMLMPGFSETYVPVRIRLLLAVMISIIMSQALSGQLPPVPTTLFGLLSIVAAETLVGVFIGSLSRMVIAAVDVAGMIIAYQSSLASALTQSVSTSQGQGTVISNLLGYAALVLIFVTDLHHVMLRGIADSYTLFLPGQFPPVDSFAELAARTMSGAFRMSMQIASPYIISGLLLYLTAGIMSRLMPNIQIFFILMAPQLLMSFCMLLVSCSAILLWYMEYFKDSIAQFLAPQ